MEFNWKLGYFTSIIRDGNVKGVSVSSRRFEIDPENADEEIRRYEQHCVGLIEDYNSNCPEQH